MPKEQENCYEVYSTRDKIPMSLRILICGESKSGRTTFASTFPNPVFIDLDKGLRSISATDIPVVGVKKGIKTFEAVFNLVRAFEKKQEPFLSLSKGNYFETLVFDSLTAFSDDMEEEVRLFEPEPKTGPQRRGGLVRGDYGIIQSRLGAFLNWLRNMQTAKYVVFIANVQEITDELAQTQTLAPNVTGKALSPHIAGIFDEVYFIKYDEKKNLRTMLYKPTYRFYYAETKVQALRKEGGVLDNPSFDKLKKYYQS